MALSKSINLGEAQIPCVCHLCEDEKNVRWKCQECSLLMCDKCKRKVHVKFKAADEHNVIKVTDIGKDGSFQPNLFVLCDEHPEQKICIFCKKCNQLVCPVCLSEKHKDHYLESLKVAYEEKFQSLKYFQDKLKEDLAFHSTCEKELSDRTKSNRCFYENVTKTILEQEERFKKAIENETKSRLKILGDRFKEMNTATIKAQNTNVNAQKEVVSNLESVNLAIDTGSLKSVIETDQSVKSWTEPEKTYRVIDINPIELNCGSIDQTKISEMFGSLEEVSDTVQFEVLYSYRSKAIFNNIQPCQDGSVWVSDKYSCLRNMELGNEIQQRQEVKDLSVDEMLESDKGEVILSLSGQSKLVTLANDGTFKDCIDFSPYISRPLHITKSGNIVVGV
ncbi:E3 ubiquitin-protein ligase Trim36-like [Mytilus californianus]|uniref:E3 ubiquitin-protein ligase Trim36-like n=1 Tax=Mytilus californianus TaxID=6549 RepID=UPI0022466B66|nr:E3 ubiquitin-protein ligase Trim36-like [Mytilus californianus]